MSRDWFDLMKFCLPDSAFGKSIELETSVLSGDDIFVVLLELLGTHMGCDWGTFWKVDSNNLQLYPIAIWSAKQLKAPKLEQDTRFRKLSASEGNAGHVWRSQKPIWTVDILRDMCLPRSIDAATAGLRGGIWFGVKTDRAMYGVVELLGRNVVPPNAELLAEIEMLGMQLGRVIENKTTYCKKSIGDDMARASR